MAEVEVDDPRRMGPAEGGDIGDGVLLTGQPGPSGQALVEGGENLLGEPPIAFDGRRVPLFGEYLEMHALAEDGPHAGSMESQPGQGLPAFPGGVGKQPPAGLRQVLQDRRRLEQGDAGGPVYQHRYPAMWIQAQEFRAALLAMVDANVVQCVGQPQFLEGDGDLESVG